MWIELSNGDVGVPRLTASVEPPPISRRLRRVPAGRPRPRSCGHPGTIGEPAVKRTYQPSKLVRKRRQGFVPAWRPSAAARCWPTGAPRAASACRPDRGAAHVSRARPPDAPCGVPACRGEGAQGADARPGAAGAAARGRWSGAAWLYRHEEDRQRRDPQPHPPPPEGSRAAACWPNIRCRASISC